MTRARPAASQADEDWMREAIAEASRGLGRTAPNPAVGCVLVKNGKEIARGHHRRAGLPHAEAEALSRARAAASGSTAYVTLEPCAHHGRTPPCAEALVAAGVARVVVGCRDLHALVAGKGLARLRRAGIDVRIGVLEEECRELVRGFDSVVTTGRPFVHLKLAASLDGRIAARGGESRWISGAQSRRMVQHMRARAEAVLVGIGTVLADDPRLTCRIAGAPRPLRVVLDPRLQTPPQARVIRGAGKALLVASPSTPAARRRRLEEAGADVLCLDSRGTRGWSALLVALAQRGVMEVLVEGGASLAASAIRAGVVRRLSIFYNPRLLGGDGVAMIAGLGVRHPERAPRLRTRSVQSVGTDLLWEGELL
ncbi:MAG TPA: bifunctional diaminohydroxyphosphoribosylaminopyrimidine deaminase/5-amino-6-(5-phosphoribosylamino)uracil reductase RibD [Candidatus Limnocylindrales bacterium]|nr:bifunctional diaminohydroxyphosphoribosylaminopyrimidine deaminase/5-amino-6-(5-phosphoribosylamino)uracil reductase RibD [Candidatus Limnocylindrales bacterium]